jgi:hypothetical protein
MTLALLVSNGSFNAMTYMQARKQANVERDETYEQMAKYVEKGVAARKRSHMEVNPTSKAARRIKRKSSSFLYVLDNGILRLGKPKDSSWWINYVQFSDLIMQEMAIRKKFRERFRLPHKYWKETFVPKLKSHPLFEQWHDGRMYAWGKKESSPIELLSLAALKYLGRTCTFDDLQESTFISERTLQRFCRAFVEYGSTSLYDSVVIAPTTMEDAARHMHEMELAGCPGAVTSMDGTHAPMLRVKYGLKQVHKGHKLDKPARAYNVAANHRRCIQHSTAGSPCTWNDKTLIMHDEWAMKLKNGEILQDVTFYLYERLEDGTIASTLYRGAWAITDNGYLNWSITVPPFKFRSEKKILRWSEWIESIRKDVECTFGIMKKRWTILSSGIDARSIETVDQVWKTCCALHNILLVIDGRDAPWTDEGDETNCFAIQRLNSGDNEETKECDNLPENIADVVRDVNAEAKPIRLMSLEDFRMKLVNHFDILYTNRKLVWPKSIPRKTVI